MNMIEKIAWALCSHDEPCSSIVREIMDPNDPMFDRMNAKRKAATGQTCREWYLQKAAIVLQELQEPTPEMVEALSLQVYGRKTYKAKKEAELAIKKFIQAAKEGK